MENLVVDRHNQGLDQASKKHREIDVGKMESSQNVSEKQA